MARVVNLIDPDAVIVGGPLGLDPTYRRQWVEAMRSLGVVPAVVARAGRAGAAAVGCRAGRCGAGDDVVAPGVGPEPARWFDVDVTIRAEAAEDIEPIATLVEAAFGSPVEARLVAAIRSSDRYLPDLALVAERGDDIVGHVMVSLVGLRDGAVVHDVHSLSPLAVAPAWQRRGHRHGAGAGGGRQGPGGRGAHDRAGG